MQKTGLTTFLTTMGFMQIIQSRLIIVDISAITQRIGSTKRSGKRTRNTQQLAPCVVLVLYNQISSSISQTNDVALYIQNIIVDRTATVHLTRLAIRIIEKMHIAEVHQLLAVVGVVVTRSRRTICTHNIPAVTGTLMVIALHNTTISKINLPQIPAFNPSISPVTVIGDISHTIVGKALTVERSQLVLLTLL